MLASPAHRPLPDLVASKANLLSALPAVDVEEVLFRVFRDVAWEQEEARNDFHRLPVEAREHLAVLRALLADDPEAAATAMADHIRSGERYLSRVTAQLTETTAPPDRGAEDGAALLANGPA